MRVLFGAILMLFLTACGDNNSPGTATPKAVPQASGGGGVVLKLVPAQPTARDCLNAIASGGRIDGAYRWFVNDQQVPAANESKLCGDFFKRGDRVVVAVGDNASEPVAIGNSAPKINKFSVVSKDLPEGVEVTLTPEAEDIDGDEVTFSCQWTINGEVDPSANGIVFPASRKLDGARIEVAITPFDGTAEGTTYNGFVQIAKVSEPKIVSTPPAGFKGNDYSYQVVATDPGNAQLTYSLNNSPAGMSIDAATGLITWSLSGVSDGTYPVEIIVRNPQGQEARQSYDLTFRTTTTRLETKVP